MEFGSQRSKGPPQSAGPIRGVYQICRRFVFDVNVVSLSPGIGGAVVGGGTLVGSGGSGPHGPEVRAMSSRAMSFLIPPFFRASNTT